MLNCECTTQFQWGAYIYLRIWVFQHSIVDRVHKLPEKHRLACNRDCIEKISSLLQDANVFRSKESVGSSHSSKQVAHIQHVHLLEWKNIYVQFKRHKKFHWNWFWRIKYWLIKYDLSIMQNIKHEPWIIRQLWNRIWSLSYTSYFLPIRF